MHITTRLDSERGEQTVIDGEGYTTLIKRKQFSGWCIRIEEGVHDITIQNFCFRYLKGNPIKDCWTLLRWYFSK